MLKNVAFFKINKKILSSIIVLFMIFYNAMGLLEYSFAASKTYTQTVKSGIEAFPESYQSYLKEIQKEHPNWTFDAYYTGIDWNDLVANETDHGHNRVHQSSNSLWKCSCGNIATGYACASSDIIKYYMDPRNFLNSDVKIFQFLEISYNEKIHTTQGISSVIKGTFMENKKVTVTVDGVRKEMSYEEIILEAAKQSKMSPYSIATKIIQEVGSKGSDSVSGTYAGYEGYYNFYNYGATDGGSPIAKGLEYAKNGSSSQTQEQKNNVLIPWNDQYRAIIGGAKLLANSYTNAGQNTAYFYKWDVVGTTILKSGQTQEVSSSKCFGHQYMTNIQDPTSQTSKLYNTYVNANIIDEKLNFVIPVYNNMPKTNKLPTNLTTNDGKLYYMTGTDVRVRSTPSTSGTALAVMNTLDEIVAVIERKCANANGYDWDKVKTSSGVVGYMASKYLSPCEEAKNALIEGSNVKAIPNVTVKTMVNELEITSYEVTKDGTKIAETDKIGTGYKLKDTKNNKEYTLVVFGDVNGDAQITSADYVRIKNKLRGTITLNDSQNKSADVNGDGQITSADYVRVKNVLRGKASISI
ncbi:MAG: SH3 domain-containing protein [Clostridia bacterium]|nr:SH3 domain-containing protein [Clostridia bacterium]